MSDETLERYIQQYIEAQTGDEVIFTWQGGEPTLMGLDFFEKVIALQKRYKKPKQTTYHPTVASVSFWLSVLASALKIVLPKPQKVNQGLITCALA